MKYIIKKNGRRYNRINFESYEQARSYVRKKLRKTESSLNNPITDPDIGFVMHNNPSHSRYGFSINKV